LKFYDDAHTQYLPFGTYVIATQSRKCVYLILRVAREGVTSSSRESL